MTGTAPAFYPAIFYRDPVAALEWLRRAFGFEVLADHRSPDGRLQHAELGFDGGVVFLGPAQPEKGWMSPLDLPGCSDIVCVAVDHPDAHAARAKAAGAEIVHAPRDTSYGAREYMVKDLEGRPWSFSDYRPKVSA